MTLADGTCWVVTDGKPGMENQCRGLAEAVGLPTIVKRIQVLFPWRFLPPSLWIAPLAAIAASGDPLLPPWPRLLIATGRASVAPALAIQAASHGQTFAVQIQNPGTGLSRFDLVVPPRHDRLSGPNVVSTRGALHRVTAERLAAAAREFAGSVSHLPRPLVAVLIGGSNRSYRLDATAIGKLADGLRELTAEGAALLVTPSRRTGAENERILRDHLTGLPAAIWDGTGTNPYFGYLGLADVIVVTGDSVSMVSEAASTGKPVYVFELPGGSAKFRAFHQGLRDDGITRPFAGKLDRWTYPPLDDTAVVAAEVRRRLKLPPATQPAE